jgi:histone H2A
LLLSFLPGLTIPVTRVTRVLKQNKFADRYRKGSTVFISGVLEYLTAELVDLASNAAKHLGKKRITPRAISLAIRGDSDFNALLADALVSGGGVTPHINKVLIKGKKKRKGKKKKKSSKAKSGSPKKAKSPKKKKSSKKKKSAGKKSKSKASKKKKKSKKKSGGKKKKSGKSKKKAAASQEA